MRVFRILVLLAGYQYLLAQSYLEPWFWNLICSVKKQLEEQLKTKSLFVA